MEGIKGDQNFQELLAEFIKTKEFCMQFEARLNIAEALIKEEDFTDYQARARKVFSCDNCRGWGFKLVEKEYDEVIKTPCKVCNGGLYGLNQERCSFT